MKEHSSHLSLTKTERNHLKYLLRIRIQSRFVSDEVAHELNTIYRRITGYDHMRIAAHN